jgi:DNA helicase IV
VKRYVDQLWPAVHPAKLVLRLLSSERFLAAAAEGIFSAEEQSTLLWSKPSKGVGSAHWSLADAVLVDEADDLVARTASMGHIVADEAQDLSEMMLRSVGRRCSTGSATVLGDLAQATTPWGSRSWEDALTHLGKPDAHIEQLTLGFRVPGEVIEYAARLLPTIAPHLEPPRSVRRTRGELVVSQVPDIIAGAVPAARKAFGRVGSVGVILPDLLVLPVSTALSTAGVGFAVLGEVSGGQEGNEVGGSEYAAKLDLVPASLAKGLEFDHVVLLEPAEIVAGEADRLTGLRRLYVCLTRAVTSLAVLHSSGLPQELDEP